MKSRTAALLFLLMLVASGCGARLTREQWLAGVGALSAGESTGGSNGIDGGTGPGDPTVTGPTSGPNATNGPGGAAGPGGAGLPAGGNGGATDVGISGNQILIATASDITGVQAGLFKSTHQAMSALAAMVNSQGGVYGRALRPLLLDSKTDSTANRAAVQEACDKAFALVGSMSAFDNGGASKGEECGIPDISAIVVNPERELAKNVHAVNPIRPDKFVIGTGSYIKRRYPDAIKNAAMLYLNAGVTKVNALQRKRAYESIGFEFKYFQEVQVLEANYAPFVQEMKSRGIKYVNMVANYQSIQKLLQAMDQADWYPEVRDWDSVAYSPNFVQFNRRPFPAADGSIVFVNTAMSEEASTNPELQLYASWLSRVAPGAKPDFFGFYAWSAGRLFVKLATEIGPTLTRKALFAALRGVHSWDGNGLHAAHDVGNKLQGPCFLYMEIKEGKFVRKDPPGGSFMCNEGGLINT